MIPSTVIKDYLLEKFKNYHIAHDEFLVDSIFVEDSGKHMSINMETGLWQCFKSKEQGSFYHLVSFVESVPYPEASKLIRRKMFDSPESLFEDSTPRKQESIPSGARNINENKKDFRCIDFNSETTSLSESLAKKFIRSRKLTSCDFYLAIQGKYINRLIIPYEQPNSFGHKELYYFQARRILSFGMKYLNPMASEYGVKSSDILLPFNEKEKYVVVTEGPVDALSLQSIGVNATCTQGSNLSLEQARLLKGRNIILSYDNDEPGVHGMDKARNTILSKNIGAPYAVQPPKRFKDWNDFLVVASSKGEILRHINGTVKKMDYMYKVSELLH